MVGYKLLGSRLQANRKQPPIFRQEEGVGRPEDEEENAFHHAHLTPPLRPHLPLQLQGKLLLDPADELQDVLCPGLAQVDDEVAVL